MSGIQCLGVRNDCFAIGADFGGRFLIADFGTSGSIAGTGFAGSATISGSGGRPTTPEKARFTGGFLGIGFLNVVAAIYLLGDFGNKKMKCCSP